MASSFAGKTLKEDVCIFTLFNFVYQRIRLFTNVYHKDCPCENSFNGLHLIHDQSFQSSKKAAHSSK